LEWEGSGRDGRVGAWEVRLEDEFTGKTAAEGTG